jgi:transposase
MLQLTPNSVIFVATIHIDFRKGIDGLVAICKLKLFINPLNGSIFLFYNKKKTTIKILAFDGQGF